MFESEGSIILTSLESRFLLFSALEFFWLLRFSLLFLSQRFRYYYCFFNLVSLQTKDARKNTKPLDISTATFPMTGISAKHVQVIVEASRKSRKTENTV